MSTAVFQLVTAEIMADQRRRARRESIRVVAERYIDSTRGNGQGRGVVAVEFENVVGDRYHALWGVTRRPDGNWHLAGGASSRAPAIPPSQGWTSGGSWTSGREGLSTGLWVTHPDVRVARIADPNGRVMEEPVENGVALFMWDGEAFNLRSSTVELLDANGQALKSGPLRRAKWEQAGA